MVDLDELKREYGVSARVAAYWEPDPDDTRAAVSTHYLPNDTLFYGVVTGEGVFIANGTVSRETLREQVRFNDQHQGQGPH